MLLTYIIPTLFRKMITLIKQERSERTYSLVGEEVFMQYLRQQIYRVILHDVRRIATLEASEGNTLSPTNLCFSHLPIIRFSGLWKKQKGSVVMKEANPFVLLEIDNLVSIEEAEELRKRAAKIPYTYIAFVGATGRSVEIVCRFAMRTMILSRKRHSKMPIDSSTICTSPNSISMWRPESRASTRSAFSAWMPMPTTMSIPCSSTWMRRCRRFRRRLSMTASTWRRTASWVFPLTRPTWSFMSIVSPTPTTMWDVSPDDDEFDEKVLTLLADNCFRSGLPMEFALRHAYFKPAFYRLGEQIVNLKFENAYAKKLLRTLPFGKIPKSALLTYKTAFFLKEHYEFRRNAMTGAVQYRVRNGYCFEFVDLTAQAQNSMAIRALKAGLDSWDKDLRRFIESNDVALYEPLDDYLESLPRWDGKDRVEELARRVPTTHPMWQHLFHIWLLSMVAHWQGKDSLHGNALVPLIIGHQGCGKTSFCRIILPKELRTYYNENINFRNDNDINLALSTLALVNMDEFDKLTKSQQPLLKFLVSRSDFQMRPPYGKALERRRRYASFIGSTNAKRPLTDTTGNRRFLCVEVKEGETIDFQTWIDYDQLYAQLKEEVEGGARYWLTDEENEKLSKYNEKYQHINDLQSMILSLFSCPAPGEEADEWSIEQMMDEVVKHFPYYTRSDSRNEKVGILLKRELGFASKRTSNGMVYLVKKRHISEE